MPATILTCLNYTSLPDGAFAALWSRPHTPIVMLPISSQKQKQGCGVGFCHQSKCPGAVGRSLPSPGPAGLR